MPERSLQAYYPELARIGVETRIDAGGILWHEGDRGDTVALLLEGTLEVVHEPPDGEEVVLRSLEQGAVVGELAGTDGRARSATVRATAPKMVADLGTLAVANHNIYTSFQSMANSDQLTRLYTKRFLLQKMGEEIIKAEQLDQPLSVFIFDIDHFKKYNDTNGHEEGNVALTSVSEIIKSTGRRGDIIARYGGEEFVALLYGATRQEAEALGETVRATVEGTSFAGGPRQPGGRVTISAGVATFPWDAQSDEALVKAADDNLYKAKEGGRNRVVASAAEEAAAGATSHFS